MSNGVPRRNFRRASSLNALISHGPKLILRGSPFDIFGYSDDRKTERKLLADYEAMLDEVLAKLTSANHPLAVGLAAIPEKVRGYGPVKARHLVAAKADQAALLEQFRSGLPPVLKAAE